MNTEETTLKKEILRKKNLEILNDYHTVKRMFYDNIGEFDRYLNKVNKINDYETKWCIKHPFNFSFYDEMKNVNNKSFFSEKQTDKHKIELRIKDNECIYSQSSYSNTKVFHYNDRGNKWLLMYDDEYSNDYSLSSIKYRIMENGKIKKILSFGIDDHYRACFSTYDFFYKEDQIYKTVYSEYDTTSEKLLFHRGEKIIYRS